MTKHVLFVCEGNRHRSPTAEKLYAQTSGLTVKSAGLSPLARTQVTEELLEWADMVIVMEMDCRKLLKRSFSHLIHAKTIVTLNVPDEFQYLQPELMALLSEQLTPILGEPGSESCRHP